MTPESSVPRGCLLRYREPCISWASFDFSLAYKRVFPKDEVDPSVNHPNASARCCTFIMNVWVLLFLHTVFTLLTTPRCCSYEISETYRWFRASRNISLRNCLPRRSHKTKLLSSKHWSSSELTYFYVLQNTSCSHLSEKNPLS